MTGGPTPVAGRNPYTGAYQTEQFDTGSSGGPPHAYADYTPLDALASPPSAAVAASDSPAHLFAENTDPPIGAGGVEASVGADATPLGTADMWNPQTAYSVGDMVVLAGPFLILYYCVAAGTSGLGLPLPPPGRNETIIDGTVTWRQLSTGVFEIQ